MVCCRSCSGTSFGGEIDLGLQPIANRFKSGGADSEPRYDLKLTQCSACGLVQLARSFPPHELRPRFDWIKYREREDHLDEALLTLAPFLREAANVKIAAGISGYDLPLLDRVGRALGIITWQLAARNDLGIMESSFGSETYQLALTPERGREVTAHHGPNQLIVSRYLLEHAEKPLETLACFRELLAENGWLLLELPDAEQPLGQLDYQMIWEEHATYFTEETARGILQQAGFSVVTVLRFPSKFERPMLILARRDSVSSTRPLDDREIERFQRYSSSFPLLKKRFADFCRSKKSQGFNLALLGAGHFACAFVNYFDLASSFAFIADDDPNKAGRFLPGTTLSIVPSEELRGITPVIVLLCVNPDVEDKIMDKLKARLGGDMVCLSIFSSSRYFCLAT